MTQYENQSRSTHPVLSAIGTFCKVLLRLLAVIIIGALIGGGLYYGVPWVRRTLVRPVEENRARIVALEYHTRQSRERVQEETEVLQARLATLETKIGALEERAGVQEANLASHEEEIQRQGEELTQVPASISALEKEITALERELNSQAKATTELQADFEISLENLAARATDNKGYAATLSGRLALMQTAQDLLKVKLLLLEENPRIARDTVTLALTHLEDACSLLPAQIEPLTQLQTRMEELDRLIEDDSFRVGPAIESLWADVMELVLPSTVIPEQPASAATSPIPTPTPSP
ncbi:MAG: hypothetical protein K8R89_03975 [Anaerolineae bacterium]|nr:hypothetical protein [Anaerolineae bacterium]